eukprot:s1477_g3.t1
MGAGHHKLIGKTGSNRVRAFVLTSQPAQMSFSLSLGNGGGGLTSCEGRSQMICSGEALTKRRSIISCVDFYLDLYRVRDMARTACNAWFSTAATRSFATVTAAAVLAEALALPRKAEELARPGISWTRRRAPRIAKRRLRPRKRKRRNRTVRSLQLKIFG